MAQHETTNPDAALLADGILLREALAAYAVADDAYTVANIARDAAYAAFLHIDARVIATPALTEAGARMKAELVD